MVSQTSASRIPNGDLASSTFANVYGGGKELMSQLAKHCRGFRGANTRHAVFQLITTASAYFALCAVMLFFFAHKVYWASALLAFPASGFLVRLFIIQHDCGHNSFFHERRLNDWVGRCISVLTFTPYDFWRKAHTMHHASSGNLNGRGIGSLDTLTVKEYEALSPRKRLLYKVYRSPLSQLIISPILYIFVVQRFPPSQSIPFLTEYRSMPVAKSWRSIVSLDVALTVCFGLMIATLGWKALVFGYLPVVAITACVGGWLFFVQHQFENSYWGSEGDWEFNEAAVFGSSYYDLPPLFQWLTGNIGIHHVHHLCPQIPNYKLQSCLDGSEPLQAINRLTFLQSLKCIRWALWDEEQNKMVGFSALKA